MITLGKVYLVGSGINELNQLTLRAKELIETADVIVYDSLIPRDVLSLSNNNCKKIFVGKRKDEHSYKQEEINELLAQLSRNYQRIVRLKGGDPFLFGRAGEEIEYLNKNGVRFEVIPGISSIQTLEVLLNIPLTHRNYNHSVQILTGHDLGLIDFKNLADFNGNILILMGVSNINEICNNLIQAGKDLNTPVALISNLNNKPVGFQKGTLLSFTSQDLKAQKPGIILIGEIINHLEKFQQNKKKILITRPKRSYDNLSESINDLGIETEIVPLIKIKKNIFGIEKLQSKLKKIEEYSFLVFTSPTSIEIFFDLIRKSRIDIRNLDLKICVIGPGTAKALNQYCLIPDYIPNEYSSDGIIEVLKSELTSNDRVLIPRSTSINKSFLNSLTITQVDEIGIYDIIEEHPNLNQIIKNEKIEFITATSSTIARNLSKLIDQDLKDKIKVYSIGKETSKELKGFPNIIESKNFSIDGLIETIKNDFTNTVKKK